MTLILIEQTDRSDEPLLVGGGKPEKGVDELARED